LENKQTNKQRNGPSNGYATHNGKGYYVETDHIMCLGRNLNSCTLAKNKVHAVMIHFPAACCLYA
jgi:hypothetical protein